MNIKVPAFTVSKKSSYTSKCREIYWIRYLHTLVPFVINNGGQTVFNQVVGINVCCAALHVYTRGSPLALHSFLERIFLDRILLEGDFMRCVFYTI